MERYSKSVARSLLVAGLAGLLLLWTVPRGAARIVGSPIWTWESPKSTDTRYVDLNPAGTHLLVGTYDGMDETGLVALFDTTSAWPILEIPYPGTFITRVAISDAGDRIAFTAATELFVYDQAGNLILYYQDASYMLDVDFDASGTILAACTNIQGKVLLFDLESGELLWQDQPGTRVGITAFLVSIQLSDDGQRVMSFFDSGVVGDPVYAVLYETDAAVPNEPIWIDQVVEPTHGIQGEMSGNGEYYAVATSSWVKYYDMSAPVMDQKYPLWEVDGSGTDTLAQSVAISWDGTRVAHFGDWWDHPFGGPGCVELYDGMDGTQLWGIEPDIDATGAISADGLRTAFSQRTTESAMAAKNYVYDYQVDDVIWEAPGFGSLDLNAAGEILALGGGIYRPSYVGEPLQVFRIEENDPPLCGITVPTSGETVSGIVQVDGVFSDTDDGVTKIELIGPEGLQSLELSGSSSGLWSMDVDMSSAAGSSFTLRARSVDERYKHGTWFEVEVDVGFEAPTPTPTSTPDSSPTPEPGGALQIDLQMPATIYYAGDPFWLDLESWNPDAPIAGAAMVVILQVGDQYYFWPSWSPLSEGVDFAYRDVLTGRWVNSILPPMIWPEGAGQLYGLVFYAALLDPDLTGLLCELDLVAWGFDS